MIDHRGFLRTYWDSTGKVSFTSPRAFVLVTSSGSSNIGGLVLSIWSLAVLTPYRLVDNISKQAASDYYHVQRASWLLPIVDHGIDNDEEVRKYLKLHFPTQLFTSGQPVCWFVLWSGTPRNLEHV